MLQSKFACVIMHLMHLIKTVDLFAGIGGMRKGFENTGYFQTVYANDNDPYCKQTYDSNFDNVKLTLRDIRQISAINQDIPKFDFLLAGFPCQPFSVGGDRQGFSDSKGRGILFEEIVRILKEHKQAFGVLPTGFLLENVSNLQTHDGGATYKIIWDSLEELGYVMDDEIYNSLDFGVAQHRKRIYIIGFASRSLLNKFQWPTHTDQPRYTHFRDILDDCVASQYYYNDKPFYQRAKQEIVNEDFIYQYRRNYFRAFKMGYVPTLVASMGLGGHNVPIIKDSKGIRKLTPSECARLQGYNDLYMPLGLSDHHVYKQIGNTVTVPVVQAIAEQVAQAVDANSTIEQPVSSEQHLIAQK